MRRMTLPLLLAVLFISAMFSGLISYQDKVLREFESLRLSYAIDLCSDAAAFKMMDTDNINADYQTMSQAQVNPQVAMDTFVDMFCFNYGMLPTSTNREMVMNKYIANLTVAGYDGYWMAQPTCVVDDYEKTQYSLAFTPKLPYSTKADGDYFALDMGSSKAIKLMTNSSGKATSFARVKVKDLPYNEFGSLASYDVRQTTINRILTDSIGTSINAINTADSQWKNTFYVPGNLTKFTGVNPVNGPSILALVQNVDLTTGRKADAFSITGAKVTTARPIIGYTCKSHDDPTQTIKKYCYADLLQNNGVPLYPFLQFDKKSQRYLWWEFPEYKFYACRSTVDFNRLRNDASYVLPTIDTTHEKIALQMNGEIVQIDNFFMSKAEAAQAGYVYDNVLMRTEINPDSSINKLPANTN